MLIYIAKCTASYLADCEFGAKKVILDSYADY